jgi:hypothetical protein
MAVPSYPFPARNPAYPNDEDVIYTARESSTDLYCRAFERAQGEEARLHRLRYLSIEEELERAYRYVLPCEENCSACSLKFAEVIRSAANAYEIFCKSLYARFYNDSDDVNIFNHLALDLFLNLASQRVVHRMAVGEYPGFPELSQPFRQLSSWDRRSPVMPAHVPGWWAAYNHIKHTDAGLKTHATLANATSAVAALFLLIEAAFGFRVLQGGAVQSPLPSAPGRATVFTDQLMPWWARLFATA